MRLFHPTLVVIETLVIDHDCQNVVITGDMNTDFKRKNGRAERLSSFLMKNNLEPSWNKFHVDFTHEFENNGKTHTSVIDHFAWNEELSKRVTSAGVDHLVENTSDHHPIFCNIEYACKQVKTSSAAKMSKKEISLKILKDDDWEKFYQNLDMKLKNLNTPDCVNCRNVHCHDPLHKEQIDQYTTVVLKEVDLVIESVASMKRQNNRSQKIIPGWTELVKPYSDDAKFWHAIWKSAGKPFNTQLHGIM